MNNERLYEILDKISEDISELKVTTAKQEENIKEHIRRTEIAEENLGLLRQEIEPLKQHVVAINGILKGIGVISVIIGSAAGFFQISKHILDFIK
jgi:5-bromo-4-chloroindolyl phosphate hydrolysis protein